MKVSESRTLLKFVACGLAGAAASVAHAQPYLVNGSGATLLENFLASEAVTNDFIDVDEDGLIAIDGDQLAITDTSFPWDSDQYVQFTYRVVGSGNGFAELRDWGLGVLATAPDGDPANGTLNCEFSDRSFWNRVDYCVAGSSGGEPVVPPANTNNPGAFPVLSADDGTFSVVDTGGQGIAIDFAAIDVPVSWFTIQSGSAAYNRVPGAPGYGNNPTTAVNKDGTDAGQSNKLKSLTGLNGTINVNTANPDTNTVWDFPLTLTPVSAMVNYGAGIQQIEMSDLRHLMATGRRINGENLVAVTRDSGSGTRNAFSNGICLDPSYCAGENIGPRTTATDADILGTSWQPSNKGGSSRVEATVTNHRLAIGHTGAERAINSSWIGSKADLLGVRADIRGGTEFARPTTENVLDGGPNGYNITGPGTLATIGDPRSAPEVDGGYGWLEPYDDDNGNGSYDFGEDFLDINGNGVRDAVEPRPGTLAPGMRNPAAAEMVNNILRSIQAFRELPGVADTLFTPGEYLAANFLPYAAATNAPQVNPDPNEVCIPIIPNPDYNEDLQDFIAGSGTSVFDNPAYDAFNTAANGLVPSRLIGASYSEFNDPTPLSNVSATGQVYVDQSGNTISYGSALSTRNKISGDFDGNGVRNINDTAGLIAAWQDRNGGATYQAGTDLIIEVIGDFTGDGNFDAEDVRYWGDGLVLSGGTLDRAAGFAAIDNAFGGNFFGTTLATGTYDAGDSRGDVSGDGALHTKGFNPIGHDGVVDIFDIEYVCANFGDWQGPNPEASLTDALAMDLSCDMNGDLVVDAADVAAIVVDILDSTIGDIDLDGDVDGDDIAIIRSNLGNPGTYATGDINCDGVVDNADLQLACPCFPADWNCSGDILTNDFIAFLNDYNAVVGGGSPSFGDPDIAAPIGVVNTADVLSYLNAFNNTQCD